MRFLLESARKDLRRRLADPLALVLWVGIPVLIGSLMMLVSDGGGGSMPKAKVLLVDQDDTLLSHLLAGASGDSEVPLEIETVELEEGRRRIDGGEASAMLILPEGFSEAFLKEEPTTLTLVTNPAQRVLPRMVQEGLELLVEASFYLQRLVGEPLREIADGPPGDQNFFTDETIASFSSEINRRMRELEHLLFPPVLLVESEPDPDQDETPGFNLGSFILPGTLFMALLFIAQGMSEDLWKEKSQGTLVRALVAPQSMAAFLGGKLIAGSVIVLAVSLIGLGLGWTFFAMDASLAPVALLWCAFAGAAILCFFVLIQSLAKTPRAGSILTTVFLFPLMMLGGSFFPFEAMPPWMVAVGSWTPNGLALLRLKDLLHGDLPVASLLVALAGIGGPAALAFWITVRRLRGRFAR